MRASTFKPRARAGRGIATSSLANATARRLGDRIEDLARDLLGEPVSKQRASWRFGAHESLLINVAGERRGRWYSFEEQRGGDALDLVAWTRRVATRDALSWARQWLGEQR
jgi:hypothetical protein